MIRRIVSVLTISVIVAGCSLTSDGPEPTVTLLPTIEATPVPTLYIPPTATETPIPPTPTPRPPTLTPTPALRNGQIAGSGVNIYNDATVLGDVIKIVGGSAAILATGRTDDNQWLEVRFEDGSTGWVPVANVSLEVDINTLEITGFNLDPHATVKADASGLRIRQRPDANGVVVTNLEAGIPLTIDGRDQNSEWVRVNTISGSQGWAAVVYLDIYIDLTYVPVIDPNATIGIASFDAEVIAEGVGLRVRSKPSIGPDSEVYTRIDPFTPLMIIGQSSDGTWLEVRTAEGVQGWVWTNYLRVSIDLSTVPVTGEAEVYVYPTAPPLAYVPQPVGPFVPPGDLLTNVTGTSRQIFIRGQQLGNRPNVFTRVGDSITANPYMFFPIGYRNYDLGDYSYLQPVVDYFSSAVVKGTNAFANESFAARSGWTTETVLSADYVEQGWGCALGEIPLICEYRLTKPSIALIMLGTNDAPFMPTEVYRANLERIVAISIEMGVIPVLSTIPDRPDVGVAPFNAVVLETARAYGVPIWDLWSVLQALPNEGRHEDMVHLSSPPGNWDAAANLSSANVQRYGYNLRNLTALQVLDTIWRQVLAG